MDSYTKQLFRRKLPTLIIAVLIILIAFIVKLFSV